MLHSVFAAAIYKGHLAGPFSLLGFYGNRARRLVPGLLLLCATILAWGYYNLLPIDYKTVGTHATDALLFISNIVFFKESGYFDTPSHFKWLLHTWSLSVEWQFYIVYPLLIGALFKRVKTENIKHVLTGLTLISFAAAVYLSYQSPGFAYFMLPTRAWEMLCGGLLVLFPFKAANAHKTLAWVAGLSLLLAGFLLLSEKTAWPGQWALIPVVGTGLIIYAGKTNAFLANNRVIYWIGKTSYSTYLWHWPISVYLRIHDLTSTGWALAVGVLASFACGLIAYATVENIARPNKVSTITLSARTFNPRLFALTITFCLVCVSGLIVNKTNGVASRMDSEMKALSDITDVYRHFGFHKGVRGDVCHSVNVPIDFAQCFERREKMVFIWGDSYAAALYQGIKYVRDTQHPEYGIGQMTNGNGPPFFSDDVMTSDGLTLAKANSNCLDAVSKYKPDTIVITWRVDGTSAFDNHERSLSALSETISKIKQVTPTSHIVVVGPVSQWDANLVNMVLGYWKEKKEIPPEHMTYGMNRSIAEWDKYFKSRVPALGVTYVSAYDVMCNTEGCLTRLDGDISNLPTVDFGHLTTNGSIYLVKRISESIFPTSRD